MMKMKMKMKMKSPISKKEKAVVKRKEKRSPLDAIGTWLIEILLSIRKNVRMTIPRQRHRLCLTPCHFTSHLFDILFIPIPIPVPLLFFFFLFFFLLFFPIVVRTLPVPPVIIFVLRSQFLH